MIMVKKSNKTEKIVYSIQKKEKSKSILPYENYGLDFLSFNAG